MCRYFSTTTSSYLKAVFKLLADKVQGNGIDAGVEGGHVDPNVIHHQQEAGGRESRERALTRRSTGRARRHRQNNVGVAAAAALPEQLAAVGVVLVVDGLLQDATEVEGQPAQSEDQHQAEDGLGHLPPLQSQKKKKKKSILNIPAVH